MGYARVISGGPDGRYSIELDFGQADKESLLAQLAGRLVDIESELSAAIVAVNEADAKEAEQRARVDEAVAQFVGIAGGEIVPGALSEIQEAVTFEVNVMQMLQFSHIPIRALKSAIELDRANTRRLVAYWNQFQPISNRPAWCVDLTEDIPPGAYVATCDVPGDTNLVLIAAGGRPWTANDGRFFGREICSPEQAFYNAALLPGWQKWKPTYRTGVASAVDEEADTMTVTLDPSLSSAQRLNVNQPGTTLEGVPVQYLDCNAAAFEDGDRVVVQFMGQDWSAPKVIGFVDNPRECIDWPIISWPALGTKTQVNAGVLLHFFVVSSDNGDPSCDGRFTSYVGSTFSSSGNLTYPRQEVKVAYGPTPDLSAHPLFEIDVTSVPADHIVGYETHPPLPQSGVGLCPYAGQNAEAYAVSSTGITKWTAGISDITINEYSEVDGVTCVITGSKNYKRFSGIPLGLPPGDEDGWLGDPAVFATLFTETVVHSGPLWQIIGGSPVFTVTYDGPKGLVTADYERMGTSNSFRRKPIGT